MKRFLAYLCLASACASPVAALEGKAYVCEMHNQGRGGWVGEKMILSLVPEQSSGFVFDGVIRGSSEVPIAAKVTRRNEDSWKYSWRVNVKFSNGGSGSISYRATFNTTTGALNVRGFISGGDNNITGNGRCKVIQ